MKEKNSGNPTEKGLSAHDIRSLLFDARITITAIANDLGTSRAMIYYTIHKKGKGGGIVTYAIRRKIAEALDIDFRQLWGVDDPYPTWLGKYMLPRKKKRRRRKSHE
jgi:hypothetical protein